MFAVCLLCVLRDTWCLTPVMGCAHMDDHRACESSLSMSRLVYRLKTTSAVLWQCGWSGTNTPPDEGSQNYLHLASLRSAHLSAPSYSRKCRFNTFKQFVLVLRDPHLLWPKPDMFGLKAITSQIEKTTCTSCTLNHQRTSCCIC